MITKSYENRAMNDLSEDDYETLLLHLTEQLGDVLQPNAPEGEGSKTASDTLANTWNETLTAREWLTAAGKRLNIDTSDCVGV